jgi:hypothetical protein
MHKTLDTLAPAGTEAGAAELHDLYGRTMAGWNQGSGEAFAASWADDGHLVAFDPRRGEVIDRIRVPGGIFGTTANSSSRRRSLFSLKTVTTCSCDTGSAPSTPTSWSVTIEMFA